MVLAYAGAARYGALDEPLERDERWFVPIHEFTGLWASGKPVDEGRKKLRSALGGWIILALLHDEPIPRMKGIYLTPELSARPAS